MINLDCPECGGAPLAISGGRVTRCCSLCIGPADVDDPLAELPAEILEIARLPPESARTGLVGTLAAELIRRRGQVQALEARCRQQEESLRRLSAAHADGWAAVDLAMRGINAARRESLTLRSQLDQAQAGRLDRADAGVRRLVKVARAVVERGRRKLRQLTGDDSRENVATCRCDLCRLERAVRAVEGST